mmetsp:Transcript_111261/g.278551  ORF Transcript_111261/g.278551 Transcript_111261/m.278551 type:complete len:278 (-) Transcript_111261:854-1687(-)
MVVLLVLWLQLLRLRLLLLLLPIGMQAVLMCAQISAILPRGMLPVGLCQCGLWVLRPMLLMVVVMLLLLEHLVHLITVLMLVMVVVMVRIVLLLLVMLRIRCRLAVLLLLLMSRVVVNVWHRCCNMRLRWGGLVYFVRWMRGTTPCGTCHCRAATQAAGLFHRAFPCQVATNCFLNSRTTVYPELLRQGVHLQLQAVRPLLEFQMAHLRLRAPMFEAPLLRPQAVVRVAGLSGLLRAQLLHALLERAQELLLTRRPSLRLVAEPPLQLPQGLPQLSV